MMVGWRSWGGDVPCLPAGWVRGSAAQNRARDAGQPFPARKPFPGFQGFRQWSARVAVQAFGPSLHPRGSGLCLERLARLCIPPRGRVNQCSRHPADGSLPCVLLFPRPSALLAPCHPAMGCGGSVSCKPPWRRFNRVHTDSQTPDFHNVTNTQTGLLWRKHLAFYSSVSYLCSISLVTRMGRCLYDCLWAQELV